MSNTRRDTCIAWACTLLLCALCEAADAPVDAALDLYAAPQHLVRLGDGRQMNVLCQGTGTPVVILEAGAGGSTLDWRRVQRTLASSTRVCAYDRAGMGFSDPGPMPRTSEAVVADLAALVKLAGIKPPYVLVGHSLGSYFVRLYADHYPGEVVGMVLVDPSVEYQDKRFGQISPAYLELLRKDDEVAQECLRMAQAGTLAPELPIFAECTYGYSREPGFSEALYGVQVKRRLSPAFRAALLSETTEMGGADSQQLEAARRTFGSMPLIVLTASPESAEAYPGMNAEQVEAMNQLWIQMHDELTALSARGLHRRVEHSGHYIQKDRPEVVIGAVQEVIADIRSARHARQ